MQKKRLFSLALLMMAALIQPITVKAEVADENVTEETERLEGSANPLYAFHPWALLFGDRKEDYLLRARLGVTKMQKATIRQVHAFVNTVPCLTKKIALLYCGKNSHIRRHIDRLFTEKEKITLKEWETFWSNLLCPRAPETRQQKIAREKEERNKAEFSSYVYIFDNYTDKITKELALEKCYKNAPSKHQKSILYGINWMFTKNSSLTTEEWNDYWDYMVSRLSF